MYVYALKTQVKNNNMYLFYNISITKRNTKLKPCISS